MSVCDVMLHTRKRYIGTFCVTGVKKVIRVSISIVKSIEARDE